MESKYYIPTIEEFHIGFNFEYKDWNKKYKQVDFKSWINPNKENLLPFDKLTEYDLLRNFNILDMMLKRSIDDIKVKYLDKEDIESLGWKSNKVPYQFYNDNSDFYFFIPSNSSNFIILGENEICISSKRYEETIFRGIIKNKSELKILIKQLGI